MRKQKSTTKKPGRQLRVASVQLRTGPDLAANLARIEQVLAECAGRGVSIAAFPECVVTGYNHDTIKRTTAAELRAAERRLADACRRYRIDALIGTPWRTGGKVENAALIIDRSGRVRARQLKLHLVGQDEEWGCTPGRMPSPVFRVAGVPCAVFICHDSRYPELARLPVLAGAKVLFYLSHEASLRKEGKMGPYRAQVQARAVENGVYVVHANAPADPDFRGSHGQSRIVAPDGSIMHEASIIGEEVLIATLDLAEATAENGLRSLEPGPLADWWRAGLRLVKVLQ
ncbi:MAG: carbon-nitrogen hydrolase family protein [Opitutaceae bacterium]|nr:carbon-nitrogen hydrolase family protein [Opitutaceae bacterium]